MQRKNPLAALAAAGILVLVGMVGVLSIAQADGPTEQQAKLTASDGAAFDNFGFSVAISGDTAVVGAPYDAVGANTDQGSAYVFVRSGSSWSQQAKLTAFEGAAFDNFGFSVAVSGDTAVMGAWADDQGGNTNQGAAYVFVRSGSFWSQQATLIASDGGPSDYFGQSVAISGHTAVVGAWADDQGGNTDQGAAYVFVRSESSWSQQAKLTAFDGAALDSFGFSVAISGDTAVVGAYGDTIGGNSGQGSTYVFVRSESSWSQQAKLTASDGGTSDLFGVSVAITINGDTAVVGAYRDTVGGNSDQGSAYVFVRSGSSWSQQAKLAASDGAAFDYFGESVAISGDTAVVRASADDVGANLNQGSAYVFVRSGSSWSQQVKLVASDGAAFDNFGFSVAISGDTAVVGARGDDDKGSAYVFIPAALPPTPTPTPTYTPTPTPLPPTPTPTHTPTPVPGVSGLGLGVLGGLLVVVLLWTYARRRLFAGR